ncbi:hypothetical protein QBC34DRAFT_397349 [Podospora aff. communis PSN243]|uniref:Nucleoporin NUP53 n=1 Tax=Podospora aff. communis PSN243 TaxID=3040156 RepID=A0AAV9GVD1_9PEZI|nr:hypothetical protein QBC34DRAFT_397349 [Podospora aff. communis PSN243]
MAPLILHNVPDDELYVGDDGIRRPYAVMFPQQDGAGSGRSRRAAHESGSFGKSTRRSRSKTGTPARREDPTIAAADKVFSSWAAQQTQSTTPSGAGGASKRNSGLISSASAPSLGQGLDDGAAPATAQTRFVAPQEPTEVILRGYRSQQQQYAAINHYEQLAGRICEDYPREPPAELRRYKSELRDPAFTKRRALTTEERTKVNRSDSGEHWVKVTFESSEAADAAIYASPQQILGHLIYAEPYHGIPPARDEAIIDTSSLIHDEEVRAPRRGVDVLGFTKAMMNPDNFDFSPPRSQLSSRTADTTTVASTLDTSTVSSGTVTGNATSTGIDGGIALQNRKQKQAEEDLFCQRIPTARKAKLLPAEQALLPAPSVTQRIITNIPMLKWFSGSMIGNEVPRTDMGDFDWDRASLYWKIIWWLDNVFGLFGKEIVSADRDE